MSLYYLNKIKIRDEKDALEFIDMVAAKLPEIKKIIKRGSLERQSLLNHVANASNPNQTAEPVNADENASVLDRTNPRPQNTGAGADRIAQLQAAQNATAADPGEIGELNLTTALDEESEATKDNGASVADQLAKNKAELEAAIAATNDGDDDGEEDELADDDIAHHDPGGTLPTDADKTPVGARVSGKASSLKAGAAIVKKAGEAKANSLKSLKKN